jgi:DNA repair exonuclease SbcCD ATPase subunit
MMDEMLVKSKKEKSEEQVTFSEYKQFCQSTSAEKTRDISDAKDAIVQLKADIEKANADAMQTAAELKEIGADMDEWGAQKSEAQSIRAKEKADFMAIQAEYIDAIDATERALQVLKSSPGQFLQVKESLLQISAMDRLPSHTKQVIMSFLQSGQHDPAEALLQESNKQAPAAKTYESSSGGIIDMVKDLKNKFKEEKYALETEEAKKRHSSDMIVQDLTDNLERSGKESDAKTAFKAQREKDSAEASGSLADTTTSLGEDTTYLADLTKECAARAADYETNQVIRAGEVEALMKAIEIMGGAAVGGGTKYLPSLVQATSLVQLRANNQSPMQSRVAGFLKERAHKSGSKILSLIAVRVAEDPFKKIKKMIEDMVSKLMEEANEEAEHKGFCDTEMGTNKNTRDTKTEEVDKLNALIEELTAAISQLGKEAAQLADEITAIDTAVFEATSVRTEEKAKNTQTIADAKVASEATARATQVLKDFYSSNAGPAQSSSSTGILGMLEVIQSDFVRLETETTASEDAAAKAFTEFSRESSKSKAVKTTSMKHKTNGKTTKEGDLETAKKDLAGTQEELDAALAYFEKLKPSCVEAGESYEERVARRKEEIESLTDALKILEDTQ